MGTVSTKPRGLLRRTTARIDAACRLPSGLSPSVLEFHQVDRPMASTGSRTVTAGSELHRPRSTRDSVTISQQYTAGAGLRYHTVPLWWGLSFAGVRRTGLRGG